MSLRNWMMSAKVCWQSLTTGRECVKVKSNMTIWTRLRKSNKIVVSGAVIMMLAIMFVAMRMRCPNPTTNPRKSFPNPVDDKAAWNQWLLEMASNWSDTSGERNILNSCYVDEKVKCTGPEGTCSNCPNDCSNLSTSTRDRTTKLKVCVNMLFFNERGMETASYHYADLIETILGHKVIIMAEDGVTGVQLKKFEERFGPVRRYPGGDACGNSGLGKVVTDEKCHMVYSLQPGPYEGAPHLIGRNEIVPLAIHQVFHLRERGTGTAAISEWLARKQHSGCNSPDISPPFVYHLAELTPEEATATRERQSSQTVQLDAKKRFGIPADSLLLCRHGGYSEFSIPFVRKLVPKLAEKHSNLHFLFLNTDPNEMVHPNVHFVKRVEKNSREWLDFFSACDAMLHAREIGEMFGLATADFAIRGIPVITCNSSACSRDLAHIPLLGEKGLFYQDDESFYSLIDTLAVRGLPSPPRGHWNAYEAASSRIRVMEDFDSLFVQPAIRWWNQAKKRIETCAENDRVNVCDATPLLKDSNAYAFQVSVSPRCRQQACNKSSRL
mmetsp:Transcript_1974/g.2804  ORF Transcript_1974/g.2804 Transcript_1974/m.2804 type:complete len:553 (-) Transcript_1974:20-1678(-)